MGVVNISSSDGDGDRYLQGGLVVVVALSTLLADDAGRWGVERWWWW